MVSEMVVDCRSLIEFCRSFQQRRNRAARSRSSSPPSDPHRSIRRLKSLTLNSLSHPFCEQSPFAAVDIIILLLALCALAVLAIPYFTVLLREAFELVMSILDFIGEVICDAPVAYAAGFVLIFASAVVTIAVWEVYDYRSRKCGNPHCRALRKAVEFDIQLESEECVKCSPPVSEEEDTPLELGRDYRELEAELKKMAPLNGRTVLVFRAPCGCPTGRMEVWGAKKARRIKK